MRERYGDVWVCTDCYFAHHYGAHQEEHEIFVWDDEVDMDSGGSLRTVQLWFSGEDDEPVGGWHEIRFNHSLEHNREPLGYLGEFETADNTCSNHEWDREMECPICDDGSVAEYDVPDRPWPGYVDCWVCDGTGKLTWPCSECGQDSDEDGTQDFSWRSCDGCRSPLGGSRYRLSLWLRDPQPQGA